jgi:hypothetical protein
MALGVVKEFMVGRIPFLSITFSYQERIQGLICPDFPIAGFWRFGVLNFLLIPLPSIFAQ